MYNFLHKTTNICTHKFKAVISEYRVQLTGAAAATLKNA